MALSRTFSGLDAGGELVRQCLTYLSDAAFDVESSHFGREIVLLRVNERSQDGVVAAAAGDMKHGCH